MTKEKARIDISIDTHIMAKVEASLQRLTIKKYIENLVIEATTLRKKQEKENINE